MSLDLHVVYRDIKDEDKDFILNTWSNNQGAISPNNKCKKGEWGRCFKSILTKRIVIFDTIVACSRECEDQIYGFITFSVHDDYSCVHFMFVKSIYRGMGIAANLLDEIKVMPKYYSCLTESHRARKFISHNEITYNPFLFMMNEESAIELLQSKDSKLCGDGESRG